MAHFGSGDEFGDCMPETVLVLFIFVRLIMDASAPEPCQRTQRNLWRTWRANRMAAVTHLEFIDEYRDIIELAGLRFEVWKRLIGKHRQAGWPVVSIDIGNFLNKETKVAKRRLSIKRGTEHGRGVSGV